MLSVIGEFDHLLNNNNLFGIKPSLSHPSSPNSGRPIQSLSHIINDEDVTNEGKEVIVRPRPLYEVDNNLAALLSNNHLSNPATASDARKRLVYKQIERFLTILLFNIREHSKLLVKM